MLSRSLAADGRTSRFDSKEVIALAQRGRPRTGGRRSGAWRSRWRRPSPASRTIGSFTAVTTPHGSRGSNASRRWPSSCGRAHSRTLHGPGPSRRAAWDADCTGEGSRSARVDTADHRGAGARVSAACRPRARARERTRAHPALARSPHRCRSRRKAQPTRKGTLSLAAARLFPRFSPLPATTARVELLDAALVLLADHELATSTLAARVAASTRADPFAVVLAGLGAVSGPLHGRAAGGVQHLVEDAAGSRVSAAIARVLARRADPGLRPPRLPRRRSARGVPARGGCIELMPGGTRRVRRVLAAAARHVRHASRTSISRWVRWRSRSKCRSAATEAILATARTAGWVAHAIEEYAEAPLRFRAKSIYVGRRRADPPPAGRAGLEPARPSVGLKLADAMSLSAAPSWSSSPRWRPGTR